MQDLLPFGRRNDKCFTLQDQTILNGEGLSVLPVWAEGVRNLLDVLRPASDDEVSESSHFWIIDEGLLESFFAVWHYVGVMDSVTVYHPIQEGWLMHWAMAVDKQLNRLP